MIWFILRFWPYIVIPGVIVHEWAHYVFCRVTRTRVIKIVLYNPDISGGFVVHEPSTSVLSAFMISFGPFLINTLLGLSLLMATDVVGFWNFWLCASIVSQAIPSYQDSASFLSQYHEWLWRFRFSKDHIIKSIYIPIVVVLLIPFLVLMHLSALLRGIFADLAYAAFVIFFVHPYISNYFDSGLPFELKLAMLVSCLAIIPLAFVRSKALATSETLNSDGNVLAQMGLFTEAIRKFKQAIRLDPNYQESWYNRGKARLLLKKYELAIADFNRAAGLYEDSVDLGDVHNSRAVAKMKKGDLKGAVRDFDRALELNPELGQVYYNRGLAYQEMGDRQRAIIDLKKAAVLFGMKEAASAFKRLEAE